MNNKLNLFRVSLNGLSRWKTPVVRKLYTDSIYPYPHAYIDTLYPSRFLYRETYHDSPWSAKKNKQFLNLMKFFWTYWWYMLFSDPGVIFGHFTPPDPTKWTDEELGIPPEKFGSYKDWIERNTSENQS